MNFNVFKELPDVSSVKDLNLAQATIIQDRNWVELYKLFAENREYVDISQINSNMINAIVAIEDQHYREHEWLDPRGILRAALSRVGWGSTLPMQLMTNVFKLKAWIWASVSKRVAYKFRQIVLAKRLNSVLQKQIKQEKPWLSSSEIKHEMKNKILELYLNYIELWNNSFGIEAASKVFFWISSSELSVVQAAILASLPKNPTTYSPLKESGKKNLMWYFSITDASWKEYPLEWILQSDIISKFSQAIQTADFSNKKTDNASTKFLVGLGSFTITSEWKEYYIKYLNWRKDVVISRMFEDGYIDEEQLKEAYIQGLSFQFQSATFSIKAPHFVFRIKELLEQQYWETTVMEWGLVVKTTLDYKIQEMAQKSLTDNVQTLYANNATNSSMIYADTDNGDILAYVGSLDYFNDEIQGQNDMVRKPRQSGSSIKPLIYSLGFMKLPISIDTPIYDIPFQIWPDRPNNADNKFEWLLPLKYALWHSRNIPAAKMYLAAWWEDTVKPFLQSLGLSGITNDTYYGYPLALGAGEVTMLELAEAYSQLTTSTPAEFNPILEIKSSDWSILYQKEQKEKADLIPEGVKYILRRILSDPANRLAWRVTKFNVSGLAYALKTWTSNVKTDKWNRPRDWRLAAYIPNKLILMRAGNANAAPMNANAFWGTIHADPIKQFLRELLAQNYITNSEIPNVQTQWVSISKITWNIPAEGTPSSLVLSSIWFLAPSKVDEPIIDITYDAECLGLASPLTPPDQQRQWYFIPSISSFMPWNNDLEDIKTYLTDSAKWSSSETGSRVTLTPLHILFTQPSEYCSAREPSLSENTTISFLSPQDWRKISAKPEVMISIKSDWNLQTLNILVDDKQVQSKTYTKNTQTDVTTAILDLTSFTNWTHTITAQAINSKWWMNRSSISVVIQSTDSTPPYFIPEQSKITSSNGKKEIRLIFNDELSAITTGSVMAGSQTITTFQWRIINFTTSEPAIDVYVKDAYWNELHQLLDLTKDSFSS